MDYRDFLPELAPPWLSEPRGEAWFRAHGDVLDSFSERLRLAIAMRHPLYRDSDNRVTPAPSDALALHGAARGIARAPGESNLSYAGRLQKAWGTWLWAGTALGMLQQLVAAGFHTAHVIVQKGLDYSLDAAGALVVAHVPGGAWNHDNNPAAWSRFTILFPLQTGAEIFTNQSHFLRVEAATFEAGHIGGDWQWAIGGQPYFNDDLLTFRIVHGGDYSAASFEIELDGGPWVSSEYAIIDTGGVVDVGGILGVEGRDPNGVLLTLPSMTNCTFNAGDWLTWRPELFPASSDPIGYLLREIISAQKPAWATCHGIQIHTGGDLAHWPYRQIDDAKSITGLTTAAARCLATWSST